MKHAAALILIGLCASICLAQPNIGGCDIFPATDEWNRAIDADAVDPDSDCYIKVIGSFDKQGFSSAPLRLDYSFAPTAASGLSLVNISFGTDETSYQDESDWYNSTGDFLNGNSPTPWGQAYLPIPQDVPIEGRDQNGTDPSDGDRHILVLDTDKCMLYETYNSVRKNQGFEITNSAIWDLSKNVTGQRPIFWTAGDAAGLPIFPGVLRVEEITSSSEINHALRFTSKLAQAAFAAPASHFGPNDNASLPYYGLRMRLKASFDISSYSNNTQKLLRALQKYGLIFADQGTSGYISASDVWASWPDDINNEMNQQDSKRILINTTNFEVVVAPSAITRDFNHTGPACPVSSVSDTPEGSPNVGSIFMRASIWGLALLTIVKLLLF